MARKRKIPARKHHGIRDPLRQKEEQEKKLKNIVNNPPERGDDQRVSFKFAQFQKLANDAQKGKKFKRMHIGQEDKPRNEKTQKSSGPTESKKLRYVKQIAGESDIDYLKRVNRMTTESLREAEYEAKYGVSVVRNPKTGEISIKKKPLNEIDQLLKEKKMSKIKSKQGKKGKSAIKPKIDEKTAKELIKQAIREDEAEKMQEKSTGIEEYKRDVFQFGEVVHAPPTLATPRKATKSETVPRPGRKNNLLLKNLLNETGAETSLDTTKSTKSKNKPFINKVTKTQLKGKRKDLPAATRSMLENERTKMVELYRQLKKSKEKQNL